MIAVVLNARSGRGTASEAPRRIRELCEEAGRAVQVATASGKAIERAARKAVAEGCELLVAGGGDGTIGTVAGIAAEAGIPFGVLPLGTRNHFARDLGIPLELDGAMQVVLAGQTRKVDLGEVNGRVFINNSSLGVYPRLVRFRERLRQYGLAKWAAALWALLAVLRAHPFMAVRITADGEAMVRRTPFVFIGNNEYRMEGLSAARRESLSDGVLALYVMNASGRRSLLWLGWQILRGRTAELSELEVFQVAEAEVELRRRSPHVALDGELVPLRGVLRYRVRPGALSVCAPAPVPAPEDESVSAAT
ncbi:MAG TPA: diacylglycerol kinase family protein [Gemmatimonadales bacterium]|nr:diacylglycerol kinase family protein [Gemmatimonadales bacterium]